MKLKMPIVDQIVGLFIVIAILALAGLLILIGINQRWFAKNYNFSTRFNSMSGLEMGMSVTLKGFVIGKVSGIQMNPEDRFVYVDFYIYDEFYSHVVKPNSVIQLQTSPLGLGTALIFNPGKSETNIPQPPLAEGSFIFSNHMDEGKRLLSRGMVEGAASEDTLGSLIASIGPILSNLEPILVNTNQILIHVNDALEGSRDTALGNTLYNLDKSVNEIYVALATVNKGPSANTSGPLGTVLTNAASMTDTLNLELKRQLETLNSTLINLEGITANLDSLSKDPRGLAVKLIDPKGSLKTLLDDNNAIYNDVIEMMNSLAQIVNELESLSRFLTGSTPQISGILQEGQDVLDKSQDVMEALINNPLLSGGVSEKQEMPSTFQSTRDEDF
ncbi:MAG: MCE family protein [Spirochaetales bacterium]|nr:MCE family protein [Spirochaetales bacterium]